MEYITLDEIYVDWGYYLIDIWPIQRTKSYLMFGEYCRILEKHGNVVIY